MSIRDFTEESSKKIGRPSLGITKKVSLTLPEEDWNWIDEKAQGNRSQLLRYLISKEKRKGQLQ